MHFAAILLGGHRHPDFVSNYSFDAPQARSNFATTSSHPLPTSLACVELFGQSILERTAARFKQAGLNNIAVIAPPDCIGLHDSNDVTIAFPSRPGDRAALAKHALLNNLRKGVDTVLLARLGAYVELDLPAALKHHRVHSQPVTPIHDSQGSLSYWIVDTAHALSNLDSSFFSDDCSLVPCDRRDDRKDDCEIENSPVPFMVSGYVNRLADAHDFRHLVVDAFLGRCSIAPTGHEIKPGVWVDNSAHVHKTARLVAPCYVGADTRVEPGAVITRCANLERNCHVGEGSLVSNASLLPRTMVGRGLDVSSSLVDRFELVDLSRNVTLCIQDPNLISNVPPERQPIPAYLPDFAEIEPTITAADSEYSEYLSRAKGRLLEVFKGEV